MLRYYRVAMFAELLSEPEGYLLFRSWQSARSFFASLYGALEDNEAIDLAPIPSHLRPRHTAPRILAVHRVEIPEDGQLGKAISDRTRNRQPYFWVSRYAAKNPCIWSEIRLLRIEKRLDIKYEPLQDKTPDADKPKEIPDFYATNVLLFEPRLPDGSTSVHYASPAKPTPRKKVDSKRQRLTRE